MPVRCVPIVSAARLLPRATPEIVLCASIVFVTVPVSPVVITVPVTAGNVIVPDAVAVALIVVDPDDDPARIKSPLSNVCAAVQVLFELTDGICPPPAGRVAVPLENDAALSIMYPEEDPFRIRSPELIDCAAVQVCVALSAAIAPEAAGIV